MSRPLDWLLFAAIALLPVYLFSSGGLQIAHWLFVLYSAGFLVSKGVSIRREDMVLLLLFLVLLVREGTGVVLGNPFDALLPVAHVLFCMVIFNVLRRSLVADRALGWARRGIFLSALVAVAGVIAIGYGTTLDSEGQRAIGTFNNPNQLGYYAVCLASVAALLRLAGVLGISMFVATLACAVFLASASLSKAAIVAVLFTSVFSGFAFSARSRKFVFGLLFVGIALSALVAAYSAGLMDDFDAVRRLQSIGQQDDDSLVERGYVAWYDHGVGALLFGLGNTEVYDYIGHEVHSTIAYFFVTYGVFGGGLFLAFLAMWLTKSWRTFGLKGALLLCMPAMLYGITHNGSRFTIFWLLIAMTFAAASRQRSSVPHVRRAETQPRPHAYGDAHPLHGPR